MTEGFVLDHGDYEHKRQQIWVAGAPVESFWSGIKTKGATAFRVHAFRCDDCNYLEFYTTEKIDIGSSVWSM